MLIKNICENIKILKKNKNYFSTECKRKLMSSQGAALICNQVVVVDYCFTSLFGTNGYLSDLFR